MAEIRTLSNGFRVVMEPISFVRSISFGIWVMNGSRNEAAYTNGISHFIEHMMFKGTDKRTSKQIADDMDAIGGQINAFTSKEYTCYYSMTLDTHINTAIDVLSDMFFNSKFDNQEIERERNVIAEEINMYEDSPEELVYDILQENVWHSNMLGAPILGTLDTIETFDSEKIKSYYNANYLPQRTVVSIAGHFEPDEMFEKIERIFGQWTAKTTGDIELIKPGFTKGIFTKKKEIEQVHLCMGFPGIRIGTDDSFVMATLNSIFGSGMSSRLFQKIREEHGLTYATYSFSSSFKDTGITSIYAGMSANQTPEVCKLIIGEIGNLFSNKITEEQLNRTKEQLKSNLTISQESTSSRMTSIGRNTLFLNRVQTLDEIVAKIDAVTIERIYALAEKIFDYNYLSVSAVGKIDDIDFEGLFKDAAR